MPTNYSTNIVYLSKAQYQELLTNQTITVNGTTVTYNENDIYVTPQAEPITDVRINGTSIGNNGIANIPKASSSVMGAVKLGDGFYDNPNDGKLYVNIAYPDQIKTGTSNTLLIPVSRLTHSIYYGLTKLAGIDLANETVTLGIYPDASKAAIQNMLGITSLLSTEESSTAMAAHTINSTFMMNGKLHRATAAIAIGDAVEIGTNCEVVKADEVFVKKTDKATSSTPGLVRFATNAAYGIWYKNAPEDDVLRIACAGANEMKAGSSTYMPIVPSGQHTSIYYGLSKLAGVDLASETVTVGTYPETSKTAIRTLIGAAAASDIPSIPVQDVQINGSSILNQGVANIPKASSTDFGVVKIGGGNGIAIDASDHRLYINRAEDSQLKEGTSNFRPIVPSIQHSSVFYGLSKLAGVDLANETVTLGIYPETSKAAINTMLGSVSKANLEDAGITARTYSTKFGGEFSVTTAVSQDYISPYARASVTGRISKANMHRVTVNGTEYILQTRLWYEVGSSTLSSWKVYEYLGNLNLYLQNTNGVPGGTDNVPFVIISDLNNNSSIDVLTTTVGTYTIKVEQINNTQKELPKSLIWNDSYVPIEKNNNGGTYNGFSLGVNELNNNRGTFAIGYCNKITNEFANALGFANEISDSLSNTVGALNTVSGYSSTAIGSHNNVSGDHSSAIGARLTANSDNMTAIGFRNCPSNSPQEWHANTEYKKGDYVIAEVQGAGGSARRSLMCKIPHTSGSDFLSDISKWFVVTSDNGDTAFVIGNANPTSSSASNAMKVDWMGNTFIGGDIYVNCNRDSTEGTMLPTDVQINGTSIVSSGIANIPVASYDNYGVLKIGYATSGLAKDSEGYLKVSAATDTQIKTGTDSYKPIVPINQHLSTFYGLSKAAGVDMASSSNAVGTYTDTAKTAIRSMLGATSSNVIAVQDTQPTETDSKIWMMETAPEDIVVPSYVEFQALDAAVVKKTDYATSSVAGIVKPGTGLEMNGATIQMKVGSDSTVQSGAGGTFAPIGKQHQVVFFGLSKAAGVDLANETVTVGTYPATASAAIRSMLDAVGTTDYATASNVGIVKIGSGIAVESGTGKIYIDNASSANIKSGSSSIAVTPVRQHEAVFYGLAKAAGDTTQSASSNTVGTYTTEAKAAIHTMLGIDPASIAAQVDIPLVETVTGTTPSITGQPNVRYVCGEISTLSLTPPASGSMDVIFESGSTATVLTVPNTVKWPAWFDAITLEANTTYEILITDGVYGSVMTWAT